MKYLHFREINEALTFDDVLLVPGLSAVKSRSDVNTVTEFCGMDLDVPVLTAPMDTVTGIDMALAARKGGGLGILHRYMDPGLVLGALRTDRKAIVPSVGVQSEDLDKALIYVDAGAEFISVDIAHGHSELMRDFIVKLKRARPWVRVIAGNVATAEGFDYLAEAGADAVRVGVGSGCFAAKTRILMANGRYKNIEDVKIHDRVINTNGQPVEVVGVKFSGIKEVCSYKNNIWHKETVCTPDHLHWTGDMSGRANPDKLSKSKELDRVNADGTSKLGWKPASKLGNHVYPLMPNKISFEEIKDFEIPFEKFALARRGIKGFKEFPTLRPTYEMGYLIGSFLGDGFASCKTTASRNGKRNTVGVMYWSYGAKEDEIAEKTAACVEKVFGYKPAIRKEKAMTKVKVRSNPIIRWFEQFGKRQNKHLPDSLFCSNVDYLRGILDGLVDSDGYYAEDGRISLTNTSEHLMELFYFCFYRTKGYYPSVVKSTPPEEHHFGDTSNWLDSYLARSVNNPDYNNLQNHQISNVYKSLKKVVEMVKTYDIEVDCPTHTFIANHAIVHNSICSTRLQTGHGVPQLTALADVVYNSTCTKDAYIISDGGIRHIGDVAKAIAVGADVVMTGFLFAGCNETPNPSAYSGMASKRVQLEYRGKVSNVTPEGVHFDIKPTGRSAVEVLAEIRGGLRSACSYSGATDLDELAIKAKFIRVSGASVAENGVRSR